MHPFVLCKLIMKVNYFFYHPFSLYFYSQGTILCFNCLNHHWTAKASMFHYNDYIYLYCIGKPRKPSFHYLVQSTAALDFLNLLTSGFKTSQLHRGEWFVYFSWQLLLEETCQSPVTCWLQKPTRPPSEIIYFSPENTHPHIHPPWSLVQGDVKPQYVIICICESVIGEKQRSK